jgi:uncharacterized repeat protein (TIGR03809 family)
MAETIPRCMSASLVEKLHALAERRCAHLTELQQSGRWSRYYSKEDFAARVGDASRAAAQWQQMRNAGGVASDSVNGPAALILFAVPAGAAGAT